MKKVKLTRGKFATVDNDVYEKVNKYNWYYIEGGYAARDDFSSGKRKMVYMHRFIMDPPEGMVIDHINGKKHDNRKENLRICTHRQNSWNAKKRTDNKSGYRGVSWDKSKQKWGVRLKVGNLYKFGGYFTNKIEASKRYGELVEKYRDEFSKV